MNQTQKILHKFFAENDSNSLAYNDLVSLFSQEDGRYTANLSENRDEHQWEMRDKDFKKLSQDFLLQIDDDSNNAELARLATLIDKSHNKTNHEKEANHRDALNVYREIEAENERMISFFEEREKHRADRYKSNRTNTLQHYLVNLKGSLALYQKDSPIYQATLTHIQYYEGELLNLEAAEE